MQQPNSPKLEPLDVSIIVFLLGLMSCFAGNILGVELAVMQNDQACQRVMQAVKKSWDAGDTDTETLIRAAQGAIRECGPETFMVSTPACTFIRDDVKKGEHYLWVGTKILAKVPAPALMISADKENKLEFHRTYVLNLDAPTDADTDSKPDGNSEPGITSPQDGG